MVERGKMPTHKNQDKHAKLAILSFAASNKSHHTYFRPKSYTLVFCNSRMFLFHLSAVLLHLTIKHEKKRYWKLKIVLALVFLRLIPRYCTDSLCFFPLLLSFRPLNQTLHIWESRKLPRENDSMSHKNCQLSTAFV